MAFRRFLWASRLIPQIGSLVFFLILLAGCGGGSGSGSGTGPSKDFSISADPSSLVIGAGGTVISNISISGVNGFAELVDVAVSGLPSGVTASPSTFTLGIAALQAVKISAANAAPLGTFNIAFQGVSGSLSHGMTVSLGIEAPVTGAHAPFRTRYLRTNSFYDPNSLQFAPPHFTVYDPTHKRFFISNPFLNEIDVFDATQEIQIGQIVVPLAWGLDLSPYNGSLYAATLLGDVYQIDPGALSITKRYASTSIGPYGFAATEVFVLSDGRLALLGSQGGILGVDGASSAAVWDPLTNSLDAGSGGGSICLGGIGGFAVSGDRSRVLMTVVTEGGGGEPICSYDPVAKQATMGVFPQATFVREIIPTPDGKRFFLTTNLYGVAVYDAKTVQLLGQITGPNSYSGIPNAASGAVMSPDGNTLYLVDQSSAAVGAYDTNSFLQTGWVPSFTVIDGQAGLVIAAIDDTGLIAGPMGHGVGFIDASKLTPNQATYINPGYASPATGPLVGGTALLRIASAQITDSATLIQILVGNVAGSNALLPPNPGDASEAQVTTPPSTQAGPVDLTVELNDGAVGIEPEAFSYGPTILEVVPNAATADGGQQGAIIGYGLGQTPADVQVTVGGQAAPVTAVYSSPPISPYPFPTQGLQFTVPPGVAGSAVDVQVTTVNGSTTVAGAFHYAAAVASYPLTDPLQSGIYDARRDLYYFAGQTQIEVLSKADGRWHAPIALPGTTAKTQLLVVSESPDESRLAVSDYGGQAIYVLDPDNPGSAKQYPMPQFAGSLDYAPSGLAITNAGIVYFATADINGTGTPAFRKLNTSTGKFTDLGGLQSAGNDDGLTRVLLSPDGSRLYSCIDGVTFWLDPADDQIYYSSATASNSGGAPDLAVSGDGSTVDIDGYLTDPSLNPENTPAYVDWETWLPAATTGQKLNRDGSIMFLPLTDGIDLLSRNTGRLLYRVQIPGTVTDVYDSLVIGPGTNELAVITTAGVSVVDLSGLPIPAANSQPFLTVVHGKALVSNSQTRPAKRRSGGLQYPEARPKVKTRSETERSAAIHW